MAKSPCLCAPACSDEPSGRSVFFNQKGTSWQPGTSANPVGTVAPARYLSCPSPPTAPAVICNQNGNVHQNQKPWPSLRASVTLCSIKKARHGSQEPQQIPLVP